MSWSKNAENTSTSLDYGITPVSGSDARTVVININTSSNYADNKRLGGWGVNGTGSRWAWRLDHSTGYIFRVEAGNGYFSGNTAGLNDGLDHVIAFGVPASDNLTNAVMYVDGVKQTLTKSTVTVNTGTGSFKIGVDATITSDSGPVCKHSEISVYNRLLSDSEMESITGSSLSATLIPNGLILHSPLIRNLVDVLGLATITENGGANASIASHPRIILPTAQIIPFSTAIGGATYSQSIAGSMTPAGALATAVSFTSAVDGSITPAGALAKLTKKSFSAVITGTGALIKQTSKLLSGNLTIAGAITKRISRLLTANITPTGALTPAATILNAISGAITMAGTVAGTIVIIVAVASNILKNVLRDVLRAVIRKP